jgi:hypothetical protein
LKRQLSLPVSTISQCGADEAIPNAKFVVTITEVREQLLTLPIGQRPQSTAELRALVFGPDERSANEARGPLLA